MHRLRESSRPLHTPRRAQSTQLIGNAIAAASGGWRAPRIRNLSSCQLGPPGLFRARGPRSGSVYARAAWFACTQARKLAAPAGSCNCSQRRTPSQTARRGHVDMDHAWPPAPPSLTCIQAAPVHRRAAAFHARPSPGLRGGP